MSDKTCDSDPRNQGERKLHWNRARDAPRRRSPAGRRVGGGPERGAAAKRAQSNARPRGLPRPRSRALDTPDSRGGHPDTSPDNIRLGGLPTSQPRLPLSVSARSKPSVGPPRPGPARHFRRARPPAERNRDRAGARGCRGRAGRAGRGRGSVCSRPPGPPPGQRSSRKPRAQYRPGLPAGTQASAPGELTALTRAEVGVASACGAAGTAPAPVPFPDPFFPSPQSWGTRRPPRKAARWRAVSPGPGLGTAPGGPARGSERPSGSVPRGRGMVQASLQRSGAARGGPGDRCLPPPPSPQVPREGWTRGAGWREEGEERSSRFPFSLKRGGFTRSETLLQIRFG